MYMRFYSLVSLGIFVIVQVPSCLPRAELQPHCVCVVVAVRVGCARGAQLVLGATNSGSNPQWSEQGACLPLIPSADNIAKRTNAAPN